ncbi:MAG: segregation/condensation protein A [Ignavibacteriae bacterium]|nr:segregation/condensation protein A [Ignavibacteriota bacterium]MCB9220790.1 segregation/condensation protein A [Ignavibacteria bacterium]
MYRIHLPNFEGPFDLLLYFIRRDELDIYDIPISKITEEFQSYVRVMKLLDLELAGEFILMASTLMYIKAKLLLPKPKDENGEEIEDPRTELVQKLLEYKQIKEASEELRHAEEKNLHYHERKFFNNDESAEVIYTNTTMFDLLTAFKTAVDRIDNAIQEHVVELIPISVEEQKVELVKIVNMRGRIKFLDFTSNKPKSFIVVTFLALLELIRSNELFISQDDLFNDIIISPSINLN